MMHAVHWSMGFVLWWWLVVTGWGYQQRRPSSTSRLGPPLPASLQDLSKPSETDRIQAYQQLTMMTIQRLLLSSRVQKRTEVASEAVATLGDKAGHYDDPESPQSISNLLLQLKSWSNPAKPLTEGNASLPNYLPAFSVSRSSRTWRKALRQRRQLKDLFHVDNTQSFTQTSNKVIDTRDIILSNCYQDLMEKLTQFTRHNAPKTTSNSDEEYSWSTSRTSAEPSSTTMAAKDSPTMSSMSNSDSYDETLIQQPYSLLQQDRLQKDLRHLLWAFHQELHSPTTFSITTTKLLRKKFITSTLLTMLYDYLTLSGDLILLCMAFELYQNQPWVTPKTHLLQASVAAMRKSSTHKNCHRYAVAYFHKVKSIFPINNITLYNRYQQLDATDILSLQVESLKHHIQLYIVQAYDTEYPTEFAKRSEKYAHLLFINQSVEGATVPNSLESPPTSSSILIAQEQLVEDIMIMAENTQTLSSYWSESSRKDLLDWLLPRYLTAVDQRDLLLASCLLHVLLKFCRGFLLPRYFKYYQELLDNETKEAPQALFS